MLVEMAQSEEVASGRRRVHGDPAFPAAVLQRADRPVVRPDDDLAVEVGLAGSLHDPGEGIGPVLGHPRVDEGVGEGDVDLAAHDHFLVLVERVREDLAQRQARGLAQVLHQLVVALVRGLVGVLGKIGVRDRPFRFRRDHLGTLGQVDADCRFVRCRRPSARNAMDNAKRTRGTDVHSP
jgi:hypothetical protein